MGGLLETGADEMIPEEFETSIEVFSRVLAKYLIPRNEIDQLISEVRMDGYKMLRAREKIPDAFSNLKRKLPDIDIGNFRVHPEASANGKSGPDPVRRHPRLHGPTQYPYKTVRIVS